MECRYCGQRRRTGTKYCPNCGGRRGARRSSRRGRCSPHMRRRAHTARLYRGIPRRKRRAMPTACSNPAPGWAGSFRPITHGKFADIAAGGRGRFNAAAFFLGPFHQLYRGCYKRFARTYLPYWLALLSVLGVSPFHFLESCVWSWPATAAGPQSRRRRFSCGSPRSCCCPWA